MMKLCRKKEGKREKALKVGNELLGKDCLFNFCVWLPAEAQVLKNPQFSQMVFVNDFVPCQRL